MDVTRWNGLWSHDMEFGSTPLPNIAMHPPFRRAFLSLIRLHPLLWTLVLMGTVATLAGCDPAGEGTEPVGDVAPENGALDEAAPPSPETVTGPTDPGTRALSEGVWILTHLSGEEVRLPQDWPDLPFLTWDPREAAASGSGGCNRFGGIGFVDGDRFTVQGIAATRRFCEGVMEVEEAFFAALSEGGRLVPEGDVLRLMAVDPDTGEAGSELARFVRGQVMEAGDPESQ
ncbi:MAG: META domain-containing protein [Gemmatimonadales bacterium]|nr:MAG: META domain-containing protein [Gemmatimonadales bacterium]